MAIRRAYCKRLKKKNTKIFVVFVLFFYLRLVRNNIIQFKCNQCTTYVLTKKLCKFRISWRVIDGLKQCAAAFLHPPKSESAGAKSTRCNSKKSVVRTARKIAKNFPFIGMSLNKMKTMI